MPGLKAVVPILVLSHHQSARKLLMNNADRISGFKLMNHSITYEQSKNTASSSTSSNNTGDLFGFLNGQKCGMKTVKKARWKRQKMRDSYSAL
jgi:hypothetical protein